MRTFDINDSVLIPCVVLLETASSKVKFKFVQLSVNGFLERTITAVVCTARETVERI